jgi:hypothetical protein
MEPNYCKTLSSDVPGHRVLQACSDLLLGAIVQVWQVATTLISQAASCCQ